MEGVPRHQPISRLIVTLEQVRHSLSGVFYYFTGKRFLHCRHIPPIFLEEASHGFTWVGGRALGSCLPPSVGLMVGGGGDAGEPIEPAAPALPPLPKCTGALILGAS